MTPAQILKALRRRLVGVAARGLSAAEMRRELAYTVRRFKLSEKVTSALMERVEGELSYVATHTAAPDTRRAAVELVRPFAGPVSRLDGALLQQFERRVLPLVEKGARVSDVEARIRRAVGVTEASAKTLASTVVAGADRASSLIAAQQAGVTHYRYAGPPGERHFCSDLTRRSAAGETWTLEQIRAMVNGHGLPVEFYCGGYRCRHRWVAAPQVDIQRASKGMLLGRPDEPDPALKGVPQLSGTPVSSAIVLPSDESLARAARHALMLVDHVHGDGVLPPVPVSWLSGRSSQHGEYHSKGAGVSYSPTGIFISRKAPLRLTVLHEIGHFVDQQALPDRGKGAFSSTDPDGGDLKGWWRAVKKTKTYKSLARAAANTKVPYIRELFWSEEIWARAYSQYITIRSGDPEALRQLDAERGVWKSLSYWTDEEFEPIATEMDTLFERLGWIQNPRK